MILKIGEPFPREWQDITEVNKQKQEARLWAVPLKFSRNRDDGTCEQAYTSNFQIPHPTWQGEKQVLGQMGSSDLTTATHNAFVPRDG